MTTSAQNKAIVLEAFDTLFNKRDYTKAATYWSPDYTRHSAHIAPGLHGRFTGNGGPANLIAADILRMESGVLAEHWDVLQGEVTREQSKSGLPMFGSSFPA